MDVFPGVSKGRILKTLKKEKDYNNFRATIAEVEIGLLLDSLGFHLDYDKKWNKQTPDWTLSSGNQVAICEVYRLGKSKTDQDLFNFQNRVMSELAKLPYKYIIKIDNINQYSCDINILKNQIHIWLSQGAKQIGESTILDSGVKITTLADHNLGSLQCIFQPSLINIKPDKIIQDPNKKPNSLTKKITKYSSLIYQHQMPYIIAVSLDFVSGIHFDTFKRHFLGTGVLFNNSLNLPIDMIPDYKGEQWTDLGRFYTDSDLDILSGFIVKDDGQYHFLANPKKTQIIHQAKYQAMLSELYSINKNL